MSPTALSGKMRARADADQLATDHQVRTLADAFDKAADGFYATPQTVTVQQFMAAWTRARRAWCEHSGEPLL